MVSQEGATRNWILPDLTGLTEDELSGTILKPLEDKLLQRGTLNDPNQHYPYH